MLKLYELADTNLDFYVMSRPWLKRDAFDIDEAGLTHIFNEQLEREVSSWLKQKDQESLTKKSYEKADSLKNYPYKNVFMDNYGEPILDKNNNLIGYIVNNSEYASIETYYNSYNLLCNKVSIREFDRMKLSFKNVHDDLTSWVDIKTEFGFLREYNRTKYYYDNNNILTNVEVIFNYTKFPSYKKDVKLNDKTGTIDF